MTPRITIRRRGQIVPLLASVDWFSGCRGEGVGVYCSGPEKENCLIPLRKLPMYLLYMYITVYEQFLKRQCYEIFTLVFIIKQLLLVPLDIPREDFEFFRNIRAVIRHYS
jgi:hypothetical protein